MTLLSLRNKIISYAIANSTEGNKKYLYVLELIVVAIVYIFAVNIWKKFLDPGLTVGSDFFLLGFVNIFIWGIFYKFTIIAKIPRTQKYMQIFFQFVRISFIGVLTLLAFKLLFGLGTVNWFFILFYSGLNLFIIFHLRVLTYMVFKIYRANGQDLHHVVVLADWYSDMFIEKILHEKEWGFKISKVISDSNLIREKYGNDFEILPDDTDIKKIIDKEVIDEVIYCKGVVDDDKIRELTGICNEVGVIFRMQYDLSPLEEFQIQLKTMNDSSQLSLADRPSNNISLLLKQVSDIYFSFTMLILLAPFFLILGIIIRLDSRGPVLFKQERVGLRGRRFTMYKFRTMVPNAENLLRTLQERNEADGPVFKIKSDPRLTRVGRILRKTGLDELPQLYNVFRGEMSLIGPRPPLPCEIEKYERWQLRRLSVKPGITCSWQIIPNRNDMKFENWMKLDLQYIDNWSLQKDVSLFFRTIKTFFTAAGQ